MLFQIDRLGRTILHLIIQYDLHECLEEEILINLNIKNLEDLFIKDFNGDTAIDYLYIYNSSESCKKILEYFKNLVNELYKEIKRYNIDFIKKCFI